LPFGKSSQKRLSYIKLMSNDREQHLVETLVETIAQLEDQLRAAQRELFLAHERVNRVKAEFIANISHEIRTPMNAVLGYADLLAEHTHEEPQRRYLEALSLAAKTLMALLNDILDLAKLENGKLYLQHEVVNTRRLFHEVYGVFAHQLRQKHLQSSIEIDSSVPPSLLLDGTRLRQILFNVLSNAVKFTERGFVTLSARMEDHHQTDHNAVQDVAQDAVHDVARDLVIKIRDSGIGIPPEHLTTIFQTFWQYDGSSTRKYGGTGLGLAITRRLVEMMNGSITAESHVGKGSTFTIRLAAVQIPQHVAADSDDQELPDAISFRNATVLIADDAEFDRILLADILQQVDCTVLQASNGRQAVDVATRMRPQLIIASLAMPNVNGYDVAFILKNIEHLSSIPIIALNDGVQRLADNAHIYVPTLLKPYVATINKPFQKREVLSVLLHVLPYTSSANAAQSHPHTSSPTASSPTESLNLDMSSQEAYQVLQHLNTELTATWSILQHTIVFDDVERLGERLVALGHKFRWQPFQMLGKGLITSAQECNITNIQQQMEHLSRLVQQVQADAEGYQRQQ